MVSQHTANVPSVHARLGSIPRLSAKFVSKKVRVSGGYGWPRLPVVQTERPGSNPVSPTIEGPVVQLAEATGSKSVKSGFESQRGHELAEFGPICARLLPRTRRIGCGRNLCPFDSKAVQVFAQAIGIVRGRFAAA